MKKFKYTSWILPLLTVALMLGSCTEDPENPSFGNDEVYIYGYLGTIPQTLAAPIGDTIRVQLQISPQQNTLTKWEKVIGESREVLAEGTTVFEYWGDSDEEFTLQFIASRFDVSDTVEFDVTYGRILFDYQVIGYLAEVGGAAASSVPYNNITHLVYNRALINSDGTVDYTGVDDNIATFNAEAKTNGEYVLLGVGGVTEPYGEGSYQNSTMYSAISDPAKAPGVIASIVNYVETNNLDGVDFNVTDYSGTEGTVDFAVVAQFIEDLEAALGSDKLFSVLLPVSYWNNTLFTPITAIEGVDWFNARAHVDASISAGTPAHGNPCVSQGNFEYYTGLLTDGTVSSLPAAKVAGLITTWSPNFNWFADDYGAGDPWNYVWFDNYQNVLANHPSSPQISDGFIDTIEEDVSRGLYVTSQDIAQGIATYATAQEFFGVCIWGLEYDGTGDASVSAKVFDTMNGGE